MYGPSSSMVDDYTAERRKTEREREREKENVSPSPAHHREKKFCVRKKNEIKFLNFIKVCHN